MKVFDNTVRKARLPILEPVVPKIALKDLVLGFIQQETLAYGIVALTFELNRDYLKPSEKAQKVIPTDTPTMPEVNPKAPTDNGPKTS